MSRQQHHNVLAFPAAHGPAGHLTHDAAGPDGPGAAAGAPDTGRGETAGAEISFLQDYMAGAVERRGGSDDGIAAADLRAMAKTLEHLYRASSRIDATTTKRLIGAAALALTEDIRERER
jgi:hypothetical protein